MEIKELTSTLPVDKTDFQMKAAVLEAPRKIVVKELELPEPKADEVRIKLEGCGICASNIPVWQGRDWFEYPIAPGNPGHEGWGIVDAVGDAVATVKVGDRVAALSYHAYATHDIAKAENVLILPEFLNGKPFPGEPLGCAMNIFERSKIKEGDTVAVIGCGFLGLLLIQLLKVKNCNVIAISRRDFSLEAAKEQGADEIIPLDNHQEIIDKVKELTNDEFCDKVIECTGIEWPLNLAIELTKIRGRLVIAGFHQDGMRSLNVQLLNWRGIDMISAHERDPAAYLEGMKRAVSAIEEGRMNPFPLFTHTYTLENLDEGFHDLESRKNGFIKGLLQNGNT